MIRRPPRSTLFPYTRSSDLCMDNDDLRRGRPTTHRAFDVATATRAGYHMVALAARVLAAGLDTLGLDPDRRRAIPLQLYRAAGARGMIRGQALHLQAEGRRLPMPELPGGPRRQNRPPLAPPRV